MRIREPMTAEKVSDSLMFDMPLGIYDAKHGIDLKVLVCP
jgi:hypothetical protein